MNTRRDFIRNATSAAWLLATTDITRLPVPLQQPGATPEEPLPWYKRTLRWGQVNITEKDPPVYDIPFWRNYWQTTATQGVIVNAGGIVAYYPTQIPLHHKAEYLGDRDLFGDICRAAHTDGLAVFARMDSNRAHEECYRAHPDWFAVNAEGKPYQAADLYISCINSPYYSEHIPAILEEIARLYHPEGFTDNSWSGLGRDSICYCMHCQKSFRDRAGQVLPAEKNWDDPTYRQWITWSYERRLAIWDLNNRVTRAAGGPHCIWSGMNGGSVSGQSRSFRDFAAIARRADILMLDDQARTDTGGFQHNGEAGKLIHGLLGWDKLIPESMAMYQAHKPWFRLASKPEPEARMWMIEGMAGGIQPWWHMVAAYHEDRRMYHNPTALFHWNRDNEQYLINRTPIATIGLVWSQQNMDFYGRDNTEERVELPWRGMAGALIRARIPYLPVHIDHIDREAASLSLLVLPNLAAMTDEQVASIRRFVDKGGHLLATGDTSLCDAWGQPRADLALADLFGAHLTQARSPYQRPAMEKMAGEAYHTYLRLGPGRRHDILKGFEETDILPFGGLLDPLRVDPGAEVPLTYIPQFPTYPPEKAWMRIPKTDIPALILRKHSSGSRIAFLPADLDRQYGRSNLPDHGNLLRQLIEWTAGDTIPLSVEGAGLVDCHLYRQPGPPARLVLHLVNLTNENTWRQSLDELIPIGPLRVKVRLPSGTRAGQLKSIVSGHTFPSAVRDGWCHFTIPSIPDHEVVVIS